MFGVIVLSKHQWSLWNHVTWLLPLFSTLYCDLNSSVWDSSDKLSEGPKSKKNISPQNVPFLFRPSQCEFWEIVTCPATVLFYNKWLLKPILTDSWSSHRGFLVVTLLRGYFGHSLIVQEQIIGLAFAIWAFTESNQIVDSHFLPHLVLNTILKNFKLFQFHMIHMSNTN